MNDFEKLHIYPQYAWHSEAFIVGNKEALIHLRDALNEAINKGLSKTIFFAADGEGYDVHVLEESRTERWNELREPYTYEHALDKREDAKGPWDLLKEKKTPA